MPRKIVLLINPSREYTRHLLSGFGQYARLHTLWTFYRPLGFDEAACEGKIIPFLRRLKPDGVFMREPPEIDRIIKMGVPIVCVPYTQEQVPGVINLLSDHEAVGKTAGRHLLDRGLRHFAYCGFDDWWWSRRRRDSFCAEVNRAGFPTDVYVAPYAKSRSRRPSGWDEEMRSVGTWLAALPKPVGVMACNDDRAEVVLNACRTADLRVPDQVAVVGVGDDSMICDLCNPSLSSVAMNTQKVAYKAAQSLDRILMGHQSDSPALRIQPTGVVMRQSTDILAIEDAQVVAAVRFIQNQARSPVAVEDVAVHAGLSRRMLERRFRRALQRSVHDEIRRSRLDRLTRLLGETQMSISEIAEAMRFSDAAHMCRFFRREAGISPAQYRKQRLI